jgi:hypothetical protein
MYNKQDHMTVTTTATSDGNLNGYLLGFRDSNISSSMRSSKLQASRLNNTAS